MVDFSVRSNEKFPLFLDYSQTVLCVVILFSKCELKTIEQVE